MFKQIGDAIYAIAIQVIEEVARLLSESRNREVAETPPRISTQLIRRRARPSCLDIVSRYRSALRRSGAFDTNRPRRAKSTTKL